MKNERFAWQTQSTGKRKSVAIAEICLLPSLKKVMRANSCLFVHVCRRRSPAQFTKFGGRYYLPKWKHYSVLK